MNRLHFICLFLLALISSKVSAQLEKVIVETYYISDSLDATDDIGGYLEPGSVTYRIYADLQDGSTVNKIYGDGDHPIKIISTRAFFNNQDRDVSFAKDMTRTRLSENTVALDTWLTIGQATKSSSITYFGTPKILDTNGSIIGGANNDGGGAGIAGGLLNNNDILAGDPITVSDGLDTSSIIPSNWVDNGIRDIVSGIDSTIFGAAKKDSVFISYNMALQNSGTKGPNNNGNIVLLAQLTTKGELSFEINLEIRDSSGTVQKYVGNDSIINTDEKLSRYLKYPFQFVCGCPDANYLQYNPNRDCDNTDSCKNTIVFGCMDVNACNFNPDANYAVPFLCCYPGSCNDRDIETVCPEITTVFDFVVYPNPANSEITIEIPNGSNESIKYVIYDSYGNKIKEQQFSSGVEYFIESINIDGLNKGVYLLFVTKGQETKNKTFIKN